MKYELVCCLLFVLLSGIVLPLNHVQAAGGTVSPIKGPPSTIFTFTVSGFANREELATWLVDPEGNTHESELTIVADSMGQATFMWNAPSGIFGCYWHMQVRGYRSRDEVDIPFCIEAERPHPPNISYMVMPAPQGGPGTTFTFVARGGGLEPYEQVGSWFIAPDGTTLDVDYGISTDANTQVYRIWTVPDDAMSGEWIFRAKGINTEAHIDVPFTIDNPARPEGMPPPPKYTVTPAGSACGTTFFFTAKHFKPGERVSTWLIQPDGTMRDNAVDVYSYADNATGEIAWSWQAPCDAIGGRWQMVALGVQTRVEYAIAFDVYGIAPTPERPKNIAVSPVRGPKGTLLYFSAWGYTPGEAVFYWAVDPTGYPHANAEKLTANSTGHVAWEWDVEHDHPSGQWFMAARGDTSRIEQQVSFYVSDEVAYATEVKPPMGAPGTTFDFTAAGFWAEEHMDFWVTDSLGNTHDVERDLDSDGNGAVWWSWTAPQQAHGGEWRMVARGEDSRIERALSFLIVRETAPAKPFGVNPSYGTPGTTYTFYADGFTTDDVAYWLTAPDGTVIPEDRTRYRELRVPVDANGRAIWSWTVPLDAQPGRWTMVVQSVQEHCDPMDPFSNCPEAIEEFVVGYKKYEIEFWVRW